MVSVSVFSDGWGFGKPQGKALMAWVDSKFSERLFRNPLCDWYLDLKQFGLSDIAAHFAEFISLKSSWLTLAKLLSIRLLKLIHPFLCPLFQKCVECLSSIQAGSWISSAGGIGTYLHLVCILWNFRIIFSKPSSQDELQIFVKRWAFSVAFTSALLSMTCWIHGRSVIFWLVNVINESIFHPSP